MPELLRLLARRFAAIPELGLYSQRFGGELRAHLLRSLKAIEATL